MTGQVISIEADSIVTGSGIIANGRITVAGSRIDRVGKPVATNGGLQMRAAIVLPGFIDLHIHGFGGHAFDDGADAITAIARSLARHGVTTAYATLGRGADLDAIARSVACVAPEVGRSTGGATIAGIFLEGPYISPVRRGAWHAPHLRLPDIGELRQLIEAGAGTLLRINIAPELPGALEMIRAAVSAGLVVSIGHSDAAEAEARAAVEAGATIVNHTFNAMSGLHHRAPGLVGEAMTNDSLLAELILDGVHVDRTAAQVLYRARGPHGIALITDDVAWAGLPDGAYDRGGWSVTVSDGSARLADGTIAGSVSPFDQSLRHAQDWFTGDLEALAALTSGNAARVMGIAGQVGTIAPGFDADLVLLDDDLHVEATLVKGEVVYQRSREG